MSFNTVPWAVGAGAQLDASVARTFVNISTNDSEGVNLPGDFKVTAETTPGPSVEIAGGGITIRNYQQAGESYIGAAYTSTSQNIAATGGTGRSDLVIARVIDPDFAPWSPYTGSAILTGPYFEPYVVSGVPNTTTTADQVVSYAAYALARIDIPASTTNITNSMITDLRSLARPRFIWDYDNQSVSSKQPLTTSDTSWMDWPTNSLAVTVPTWATSAQVIIRINSILGFGGGTNANGATCYLRVNFGGDTSGPSSVYDFNAPANLTATDAIAVPINIYGTYDCTALQGQTITVKPQAERYDVVNNNNGMEVDTWHQVEFDVRFKETTA